MSLDADGTAAREDLACRLRERLGLDHSCEALVAACCGGVVDKMTTSDATRGALHAALSAGWTPVIVTNGSVDQQEAKLRRTGLDRFVAGWVISEAAGMRKPDPLIFGLAAQRVGESLTGAWMIGDSAEADIGGASASGISSVWLTRGRRWPMMSYAPTLVAGSCAAALRAVMDTARPFSCLGRSTRPLTGSSAR